MFTRFVSNAEVGVSVKAVILGSSKLFTSYLTPSLHVVLFVMKRNERWSSRAGVLPALESFEPHLRILNEYLLEVGGYDNG